MPDQGGSYGMKGFKGRALELPDGTEVAVSPDDRARIRYNHPKLQLEQSIDQGDYIPLSAVPSEDILSQANWYISTSGSNSNDGATSSTALRSHAELMRRIGGGLTDVSVTIHVLDNALANEDCYAVWNIGVNGYVRYLGYVTATLASGTFTAVTDIDKPNNIPFDITDTNLSDTWANLGLINERIRITSGAREGAIAWLAKDLGAKKARVSEWKVTELPITIYYPTVFPQVGDPYAVESLSAIKSLRLNILSGTGVVSSSGRIVFEDLSISPSELFDDAVSSAALGGYNTLFLFNCNMGVYWPQSGSASLYNCRVYWPYFAGPVQGRIAGGLVTWGCGGERGATVVLVGVTYQGSFGIVVNSGAFFSVALGTGADLGGIGCFDMGSSPVRVVGLGRFYAAAPVYGLNNAGYVFQVSESGTAVYETTSHLTAVGASGDTSIGGTPKAYAALPFFNVTNGARMVLQVW
jgi:hypothetical protein